MTNILTERFEGCSKKIENTRRTMPPVPSIPLDAFVDDLVASGLSVDDAAQFIETLAPLMWHFVNLGFEGDIFEVLLPGEEASGVNLEASPETEKGTEARKGYPST